MAFVFINLVEGFEVVDINLVFVELMAVID
jgi:hypothetical protein